MDLHTLTGVAGSDVILSWLEISYNLDRQWTFLPIAYSLHFVLYPLFNINGEAFLHNLPRLCLMWGLMVRFPDRYDMPELITILVRLFRM